MTLRIPRPLVPGDTIAITAPSSGVPEHLHPRLDLAIGQLEQKGYRVVEGQCLRTQYKNKSADKKIRATELMTFLSDPQISAIMPPWGGDLGMELLEHLDFNLLRHLEPKWFVGFSDLTTFQFPLTTLAGWATLHGPNWGPDRLMKRRQPYGPCLKLHAEVPWYNRLHPHFRRQIINGARTPMRVFC